MTHSNGKSFCPKKLGGINPLCSFCQAPSGVRKSHICFLKNREDDISLDSFNKVKCEKTTTYRKHLSCWLFVISQIWASHGVVSKLVKCLDKDQDGVRASSFQSFKVSTMGRGRKLVKYSNFQRFKVGVGGFLKFSKWPCCHIISQTSPQQVCDWGVISRGEMVYSIECIVLCRCTALKSVWPS